MPYRDPSPPSVSRNVLPDDFWGEKNTHLEDRAVETADAAIVGGVGKLVEAWYRETKNRYPKDFHVIVQDLDLAAKGRGSYIRIQGDARRLVGILTLLLRFRGELVVQSQAFDLATQDPKALHDMEKEAALRWATDESTLQRVVLSAFASAASRLDREFLSRFEGVSPSDLMKAVYFRGVVQGDTVAFDSFQLSQDLYKLFYE